MRSAPTFVPTDVLRVRPWPDDVIDSLGHDPRSTYVETYWLGILGPSTTWFLRLVAAAFDAHPDGVELPFDDTAATLGLSGKGGRHSPFVRSITRCIQFDLATLDGDGALAVRRRVPPLNRRQVARLPEFLQVAHAEWQESLRHAAPVDQLRHQTRQLALSYVQLGEALDEVELHLMRLNFHPALCSEAARWAWEQARTSGPEAA